MKVPMRALRLPVLLAATCALFACGGGGSGSDSPSTGVTLPANNGQLSVQGSLNVASGTAATSYKVFNTNQSSSPTSSGQFSTSVTAGAPSYTYAVSETGNKVYAAINDGTSSAMTIDSRSTAEALVLLNPLLIPSNSLERSRITATVKSNTEVATLSTVIESVYSSSGDPLSDARISDALKAAVKSVLLSLQASTSAGSSAVRTAQVSSAPVRALAASGTSPLRIISNDMGALTLAGSAGSTLKLGLNIVGPGGITTNVDWIVRIVELDPSKIQWTQSGVPLLGNLINITNIDTLIKVGGYDQKTIVEGAVGSGALQFLVDPIGSVAQSFGDLLMPDSGISLHDGVYAIVALSGSPYGDAAEYTSVKNSSWQAAQAAEALSVNIGAMAVDVVGVATSFAGSNIDISPILTTALGALKGSFAANPGPLASADLSASVAILVGKLIDYLMPQLYSSIGDLQSSGLKKFFYIAVNTASSAVDVWSGTISGSSRILNYVYNITPRESAYAILGNFPTDQSQIITFASILSQTLSVAAPALSATSSSDLPVTLSSSTPSVCSVSATTLTLLGVGTCTITATQPGNSIYAPATPVSRSFTVNPAAPSAQPSCSPPQVLIGGVCTTPTPICALSFNTTNDSVAANGAQRQVILTTSGTTCTWSATSDQSWVHNITPSSGTSGATLTYTVDANTTTVARSATITAGQATLTISQVGVAAACTFSLGYTTRNISASGGTLSVGLTASSQSCSRTAQSNSTFITGVSPTSGNGDANISFTVAANTSASPRSGALSIAGQSLTIDQDGATAMAIPATPTGMSPGTTTAPGPVQPGTAVTLSWTAVNGATLYLGGLYEVATGASVVTINTGGTSATATLTAGKQYRWSVEACNSTGCSAFSANYYLQGPANGGLPPGYVLQGGLTWMPISFYSSWPAASATCAGTINGSSGWRLPTQPELSAMYASGAMIGNGWILLLTWTSTSSGPGSHFEVAMDAGIVIPYDDINNGYVTCVHS